MTRWHRDEAESSWLRHTTDDAKSDHKGRGRGEGRDSRIDTAVDECRNEMVDRVARYLFDYWNMSCYSTFVRYQVPGNIFRRQQAVSVVFCTKCMS